VYSSARVEDLTRVVAPPYDVISAEMAARLRARDPHNIVHVDLPEGAPPARYERAASLLRQWREDGTLVREERPSLYVVAQRYATRGMPERTRLGVIGCLRIEDEASGVVLPHEATMDAPRTDRLELMAATRCHLSPIFLLYTDPERTITPLLEAALNRPADRWATDDAGVETRLWRLADPAVVEALCAGLAHRPLWIADGHHRYAAARLLRDRLRPHGSGSAGPGPEELMPAYLTDADSPGLTILPYHRVLRELDGFDVERLVSGVAPHMEVKRFAFEGYEPRPAQMARRLHEMSDRGRQAIALYSGSGSFVLLVSSPGLAEHEAMAGVPGPLRGLDVVVLHRIVLEKALGLSEEAQRSGGHLAYTEDAARALGWVDSGEARAAFLLNATRAGQLRDVSSAGLRMPQKSTYFYPKILTGLVLYPLEPDGA